MTAVSFGRFVLDRETRELRDTGRTVALSPKVYKLLEVLVTNRPKAVAKLRASTAALAGNLCRREEPGQSHCRNSRCARRRRDASDVGMPDRPSVWVRLPRPDVSA